jgi:hypothetical protein
VRELAMPRFLFKTAFVGGRDLFFYPKKHAIDSFFFFSLFIYTPVGER